MRKAALALLTVLFVMVATADEEVAYTRVLVPLTASPVTGAFGSVWEIETFVLNRGSGFVRIQPDRWICVITCPVPTPDVLPPGLPPLPVVPYPHPAVDGQVGALYYLAGGDANDVKFQTRIRDVTRQAQTAGTEVPAIREDAMSAGPIDLVNVPVTFAARNMLRVYALPEIAHPEVEVQFFRMARVPVLLDSRRLALRTYPAVGGFRFSPSVAELGGWDASAEIASEDSVWIRVVPVTPGLRIWGFVSITNNQTQQVTIVTP